MLKRRKLLLVSILLAYTMAVPVFAYMYFYRTENTYIAAGIKLQSYTATMQLGFYWDIGCTQPVTSFDFDFGQIVHPNQELVLEKQIFIRNEGDVWCELHWNSTISNVTSEITDYWRDIWGPPIEGFKLVPDQIMDCYYGIVIPAYATPGTYNWTLTVWGENYY